MRCFLDNSNIETKKRRKLESRILPRVIAAGDNPYICFINVTYISFDARSLCTTHSVTDSLGSDKVHFTSTVAVKIITYCRLPNSAAASNNL